MSSSENKNEKTYQILAIFKRLLDEPPLIGQFMKALTAGALFFEEPEETIERRALNKMSDLMLHAYRTKGAMVGFGTTAFSLLVRQEEDNAALDPEVLAKIKKYTQAISGSGIPDIDTKRKEHSKYIDTLSKNDFVISNLLDRIKLNSFYAWHGRELVKLIKDKDINGAINSMNIINEDMAKLQLHTSKPFNIYHLDTLINNIDTEVDKKYLALGISDVDAELCGGFYRKTLNGFMAISGGGKSQMCTYLLSQCVKQKMRAHIVSVEEEDRLFCARLVAAVSGLPTQKLLRGTVHLTPEELKIYQAAQAAVHKYIVIEFVYDKTLEEIHRVKAEFFENIKRKIFLAKENPELYGMDVEEEIVVDILDYSGHLASSSKGDKMHEKMLEAYRSRKNFALKHNVIGFDFIQPNRDGTKKENDDGILRATDIAGGFDIVRVFDNLMSINRGKNDIEKKEARIYFDKSRTGDLKGRFWYVDTEFDKGRFNMADAKLGNGGALENVSSK